MLSALNVIKIGGNIIDNSEACVRFLEVFSQITTPKILVHGGGKIATQTAAKLGIETRMIEGRRITDRAMLDVVTMVYGGLVNKNLVAQLQAFQCNALGLTGADAGIIRAVKRPVKTIDYGFAGDIETVNAKALCNFLQSGQVPVIAPLTYSGEGYLLNTNADSMASATALALSGLFEVTLVYCFEKKGVLADVTREESVIPVLNPATYAGYKAQGVISEGMIPKLDNAFEALQSGVARVIICHAAQLQQAIDGQAGTTIHL